MQTIFNFLNKYWILLLIIFAGTGIRFYNLTKISLWHDEAFSALLIKYPWGEMMFRIGLDVHPPLYYIFLRVWHYIFGHSLFSLRAMSVAFGVGAIILVYLLVKRFFGTTKGALISAAIFAVNPFSVLYVTEARMYTMGAFFAVLSAYLLGIALQYTKFYYTEGSGLKPTRWKLFALYASFAVSSAATIYTHYYLLFGVAALGIFGLLYLFSNFKFKLISYTWLIASGLGIGVLFAPWFSWFMYQYNQVGDGYWIPPINLWSIPDTLYRLTLNIGSPSKLAMSLTTLVVIWIIYNFIKQYKRTEKWLIILSFLAPFGGALLFALIAKLQGSNSSVYMVRYFIFAAPFLCIIIGLWLHRLNLSFIKTIIFLVVIVSYAFSIVYYWQQVDPSTRSGMASLAKFLSINAENDHKIFVASSFEFFNYKYYHNYVYKKPQTALLYTNGSTTKDLPHYAGTAILTDEDLVPSFTESANSGDTVWLIWTNGFGGSKPLPPENWTELDEHGFAEIRPYVGTWVVVTQYQVN